jgi:hypothetical protein
MRGGDVGSSCCLKREMHVTMNVTFSQDHSALTNVSRCFEFGPLNSQAPGNSVDRHSCLRRIRPVPHQHQCPSRRRRSYRAEQVNTPFADAI